ncbi:MAG: winged helix-turn-helix domain-containing protein [Gammaproteobacteria bacterium]|nr:winged helix-turn-helix domain-containing protein [Gammaproteobacteria bacterium]
MSSSKLRFDGWVLDPESGDLQRAGARIRLQEQAVQVLRELIAHAGSVVPRERLIALLWPKGVVDFDTGLNTVVRKLRSALGDTSEKPRYIETLPRRGYRFIAALDPDPEATSGASAALPMSDPAGASLGPAPLSPKEAAGPSEADPAAKSSTAMRLAPGGRLRLPALAAIAALAVAMLVAGLYALWRARSSASVTNAAVQAPLQSGVPATLTPAGAAAFSPPHYSIAVLPFVNMSGDPNQQYFSDGLTEELLNSLSRIGELQVAARTSSFSFQGEHPDLTTVAHKLNVASVLEGSVRRSGHTVRVTAQLNNAVTGFHIWSETYDRDLGDVLRLQTEIATAVAEALKIKLLGDTAERMESGGTRNPDAYDAYLHSASLYWRVASASDNESVRAGYQEAVRLDPNYALAYAGWSLALGAYAELFAHGPAAVDFYRQSGTQALKAVALAPELGEGHLALAVFYERALDFSNASVEFQRAMALAPSNARVLRDYGQFAARMGRTDAGIAAARRAVALDPLNVESHGFLSGILFSARRYDQALAVYKDGLSLQPRNPWWAASAGQWIYYVLGDFEKMRAVCQGAGEAFKELQYCLALADHKLGRQAAAETALAGFKALDGNAGAYGYARIYAQWGDTPKALEWLETALQLRDPQLADAKTDPLLDPLRQEPRFKAIERELKFPPES